MILLDTHALLWWVSGDRRLSKSASAAIEDADQLAYSPISCWEIGMLHSKGRIRLKPDPKKWMAAVFEKGELVELVLSRDIMLAAATLDLRHGDHADRMLIATARHHRISLVTIDQRIVRSGLVHVVW